MEASTRATGPHPWKTPRPVLSPLDSGSQGVCVWQGGADSLLLDLAAHQKLGQPALGPVLLSHPVFSICRCLAFSDPAPLAARPCMGHVRLEGHSSQGVGLTPHPGYHRDENTRRCGLSLTEPPREQWVPGPLSSGEVWSLTPGSSNSSSLSRHRVCVSVVLGV